MIGRHHGARLAACGYRLWYPLDLRGQLRRHHAHLLHSARVEFFGRIATSRNLAMGRGHKFALERAVFLTVLHRLFESGSDRAADRWREDYAIAGVAGL